MYDFIFILPNIISRTYKLSSRLHHKVWCASREIIKGQKRPKGLKGLFIFFLFGLFGPLGPFSVAVAWHKRNRHKHYGQHSPISWEKGCRCVLDKEIAPDGTYITYFPFGAMIERTQMRPYLGKLLVHCGKELIIIPC